MIVNFNYSVVNELEASLTDDAKVVIYDCHMFVVQGTGVVFTALLLHNLPMGPIS